MYNYPKMLTLLSLFENTNILANKIGIPTYITYLCKYHFIMYIIPTYVLYRYYEDGYYESLYKITFVLEIQAK